MGSLTLEEVEALMKKLTMAEVIEVCKFESVEELVLSLGDFLEENLERVNEGIFENGLA